jgi:lipopolysaccharide transport system permease protein
MTATQSNDAPADSDGPKLRVYEPVGGRGGGLLSLARQIAADIGGSGWLTFQLLRRDLVATSKQSIAGALWFVILPLFGVAAFVVLNRAGVLAPGDVHLPYPVYAVGGLAFWQLFAMGSAAGAHSLTSSAALIGKINFSRKALVIASQGRAWVTFLVHLALLLGFQFWFGVPVRATMLLAPLLALPMLLLGLAAAFVLAIANALVRDVATSTPLVLNLLLLSTPILYEIPGRGVLSRLTHVNPFYHLVAGPRDLLLLGTLPNAVGFLLSVVFAVFALAGALLAFHVAEQRVVERL